MSDYGVIVTGSSGKPLQTYLDAYVIDVIRLTGQAGSKSYPGVTGLAVMGVGQNGPNGSPISWTVSGNTVSWRADKVDVHDLIIVMGEKGPVNTSNDYGSFLTDNNGSPLFPYDSSTYVFLKKVMIPSKAEFNTGFTMNQPPGLYFISTDRSTNYCTWPVVKNNVMYIYNMVEVPVSCYIFMPSWFVTSQQTKPDYGVVTFSENGTVNYLGGQLPLLLKRYYPKPGDGILGPPSDMGADVATICMQVGVNTVMDGNGTPMVMGHFLIGYNRTYRVPQFRVGTGYANSKYPFVIYTDRSLYD